MFYVVTVTLSKGLAMNNIPFGFSPSSGDDSNAFNMSNLGDMFTQLGEAMKRAQEVPAGEVISWPTVLESALRAIPSGAESPVGEGQSAAVENAVRLAQMWLDDVTTFPANSANAQAWDRRTWVRETLDGWKPVIQPIAEGLTSSMVNVTNMLPGMIGDESLDPQSLPPELQAAIAPMLEMAKKMSAVQASMQMGAGLGATSGEVLFSGELGLPLTSTFTPTLLPSAVVAFAEANELPSSDVMMFFAVREAATQRLFAAVPWLREEVVTAVSQFAQGMSYDQERVKQALEGFDPNNPESLNQVAAADVFAPVTTESQKIALRRLDFALSLIEGWVNVVSDAALATRTGSLEKLHEILNRRRVSGGPAERAFSALVGLNRTPSTARKVTALWAEVTKVMGVDQRDALIAHPDFAPGIDDLDDVAKFIESRQEI